MPTNASLVLEKRVKCPPKWQKRVGRCCSAENKASPWTCKIKMIFVPGWSAHDGSMCGQASTTRPIWTAIFRIVLRHHGPLLILTLIFFFFQWREEFALASGLSQGTERKAYRCRLPVPFCLFLFPFFLRFLALFLFLAWARGRLHLRLSTAAVCISHFSRTHFGSVCSSAANAVDCLLFGRSVGRDIPNRIITCSASPHQNLLLIIQSVAACSRQS